MAGSAISPAQPPMMAGSPWLIASLASFFSLLLLGGHLVVVVLVVLSSLILLSSPVTVLVKRVAGYVPGVRIDTGTLLGG